MKKHTPLLISILYLVSLYLTNTFHAMEQDQNYHLHLEADFPQKTIILENLTEKELQSQVKNLRKKWQQSLIEKQKYILYYRMQKDNNVNISAENNKAILDGLNSHIYEHYSETQTAIRLLHSKFGCVVKKHPAGHYIFHSRN